MRLKSEKHEVELLNKLEKFHNKNHHRLKEIIINALKKYDTDEYVMKWHSRGQEPPEEFAWFLLDYARKYGQKCTKAEYKKYANDFTGEIYFIEGFYVQVMHGQGSVMKIDPES
jgi:hypothetical protein